MCGSGQPGHVRLGLSVCAGKLLVMTQLEVPVECMWWAVEQPPELVVLDDMAVVDLDWWNSRCAQREIPVHITGRDADGVVVDSGRVFVRRGDLVPARTAPADTPLDRLTRLYLCAAWLYGHTDRHRVKRFMDVRAVSGRGDRLAALDATLRACEFWNGDAALMPGRGWSGWPTAPRVGHSVLSLYLWAVYPPAALGHRPQLLDPQAVASAVYHGWTELPSVPGFTMARYARYTELLSRWSEQADTTPELVEKWLVHDWRQRATTGARDRHDDRTF